MTCALYPEKERSQKKQSAVGANLVFALQIQGIFMVLLQSHVFPGLCLLPRGEHKVRPYNIYEITMNGKRNGARLFAGLK
jgi:hypothetical protein